VSTWFITLSTILLRPYPRKVNLVISSSRPLTLHLTHSPPLRLPLLPHSSSLHRPIDRLQHSNTPLRQLKHKTSTRACLNHLLRPLNQIRPSHLINSIRSTRRRQHRKLRAIASLCAGKAERDGHWGSGGRVVDGGFPDVGGSHSAGDVEERVEGAVVGAVGHCDAGGSSGKGGGEFVVGEELGRGVSGEVRGRGRGATNSNDVMTGGAGGVCWVGVEGDEGG
jgi:hypothetical protein